MVTSPSSFAYAPRLFAMPDKNRGKTSPVEVTPQEAEYLNRGGQGIFHVVNSFTGKDRRAENLSRINAWFVEFDNPGKEEQLKRLALAPIRPTQVIESRRGYHAYWAAADARIEEWKDIVRWRLCPYFDSDPQATDVLRLLRAPGYMHHKAEPFPVKTVYSRGDSYTTAQMLAAFPSFFPRVSIQYVWEQEAEGDSFWGRVARLDAGMALKILGGHWLVNGEQFVIRENSNGKRNVYVWDNGVLKSTPCFIDPQGKFGNVMHGSSIAAFCRWYGHSWAVIADGLKQVFPELGGQNVENAPQGSTQQDETRKVVG